MLESFVPCAEQLDALAVDLAATNVRVEEGFHGDNAIVQDAPTFYECGEFVEIQRGKKNGVGIGETALGNATIHRRLTALKTGSRSSMSRSLTFVAFTRRLTLTCMMISSGRTTTALKSSSQRGLWGVSPDPTPRPKRLATRREPGAGLRVFSATAPTERVLPLSEENQRQLLKPTAGATNEGTATKVDCSRRRDATGTALIIRSMMDKETR